MSSIGPQLPPELTKRKRTPDQDSHTPSPQPKQARREAPTTNDDEIDLDDSDSDSDIGPSAPPTANIGPTISASKQNKEEINLDDYSDSDTGPAPPQQPRPQPQNRDPSSSDSEDDFGPSLPSSSSARPTIGPTLPTAEPTPQRDNWMLAPPPSTSYSERDPTRMRARKFASKAKPETSTPVSIWTETPEEKLQRQKDALLGRSAPNKTSTKDQLQEERDRRIAQSIEATRGKSLYDEHSERRKESTEKVEEDDDPSQRAFDREKDMAIGGKIGGKARSELISKSANFGGRFQKGSFL